MNYKLSKREKFLLKGLAIIVLCLFIIYLETRLIDSINKSKINLFQSLDRFNQTKQSLAQLKDFEVNIKNESYTDKFESFLNLAEFNFTKNSNEYVLNNLEESAVIKILNYFEEQRISLFSLELTYDTKGVVLIVELDD